MQFQNIKEWNVEETIDLTLEEEQQEQVLIEEAENTNMSEWRKNAVK